MFRDAVADYDKKRKRVIATALILGLIALLFYVGTYVLRRYGMY